MHVVVPSQVVKFIDRTFPYMRRDVPNDNTHILTLTADIRGGLLGLVELVRFIPGRLIVDADALAQITLSIELIRTAVREAEQVSSRDRNLGAEPQLRPFVYAGGRESPTNHLNPVMAIRQALAKCPDEAPPIDSNALRFVNQDDLRHTLETDIESVRTALKHGEWKAATVLSGSVVEALLLWAILGESSGTVEAAVEAAFRKKALAKRPQSDPERWHMLDYVEVALELKMISSDVATQARLVSGFRNLIHPGRTTRTGQKCTEGTAHAAMAAVTLVTDELRARAVVDC